jgi:hypothetical protein
MDIIDITKLNVGDIYKNTIQTIIDIINDIIFLTNDTYYNNEYKKLYNNILNIIFKKDRIFYVGIIFIILSFVIYFIDGVSI